MDAGESKAWDFFLCHAHEDQATARALFDALIGRGHRVWIDERELTVGDSLRRHIDHGLRNCRFGIVLVSHAFFEKNWPQFELDGLTVLQMQGRKVILPVWHGIDAAAVARHSVLLASFYSLSTDDGIPHVAEELCRVVRPARPARPSPEAFFGDERSEWNEVGLDDVSAARSLAAKLRVGRRPPKAPSALYDVLPANEEVYWYLPASAWTYASGADGSYNQVTHHGGSVGWWAAFKAVDAVRNAVVRQRAQAKVQPRWQKIDDIDLAISNKNLWLLPKSGDPNKPWETFSISHGDTTSVAIDQGFVVVQTTGAPLGFGTHYPNWLYVALTWLRTGRIAQEY